MGSGVTTLATANPYNGPTVVNGGTLALNVNSGNALSASSAVQINNGGTIVAVNISPLGVNVAANTPTVTINAGGMLTMTASNAAGTQLAAFAPRLTLSGGTVAAASYNSTSGSGSWIFISNVIVSGTTPSTLSAPAMQLDAAGYGFDVAGFTVECSRLFQQS